MRIVVTGATGNVGTSLLPVLSADPAVDSVLGIARRFPELSLPKVEWAEADISSSELVPLFAGADVVVHLAWLIQPSHHERVLHATNVTGSERVFAAAAAAGVRSLVYASSIGGLLAGTEEAARRRDVGDERHSVEFLRPAQGGRGTVARPVRAGPPGRTRRATTQSARVQA